MKKYLASLLFLFVVCFNTYSQDEETPVEVETSVKKISETEYDLILEFYIEEGWHLYSQHNPEGGALPMTIKRSTGEKGFDVVGKATESETKKEYSDTWGQDEIFFVDEARLVQRIKVTDPSIRQVSLNVEAQTCKGICQPFDGDYTFSLDGGEVVKTVATVDDKSKKIANSLKLDLKNEELLSNSEIQKEASIKDSKKKSLFRIFLLGFLGGLIAFLTPCVFPLAPLTVSFFTKQVKNKTAAKTKAIIYGFFIVLIYVLLSLPFHIFDQLDPGVLRNLSTNVWLNLTFFIVFIFFAGSFFGYYHITLPSALSNKVDSASGLSGVIGLFFMALTLAVVSFSCTGPILGTLLASSLSSEADPIQLSMGMGGFGLALALPFTFFAIFPNFIKNLPKSGDWMTMVTTVLGFIELALAFKFLSNADLVGGWGILKREVFIAIWILIILLAALYLFGIVKFPTTKKVKRVAFMRIVFGALVVGFAVYLSTGLMKKPLWNLNLLSGLAPPQFYSLYNKGTNKCPLSLNCFKDYNEGIAYARSVEKPVILDFTGWACVNCRKMEENVWSDPKIYKMLKEEFVIISLYIDDNEHPLPLKEQFDFVKPSGKIKKILTYGDKWATMQTLNFKTASQPYYVLMSPDQRILNSPQQYTDKSEYYKWLKTGLKNYK